MGGNRAGPYTVTESCRGGQGDSGNSRNACNTTRRCPCRIFAHTREWSLVAAAARGVLEGTVEQERLNLINARAVAQARGIELSTTETPTQENPVLTRGAA